MQKLALTLVRLYQMSMSPFWGGTCRHIPTCSDYAYEAISTYGAIRGIWLTARRVGRCRPLGSRGYDPVP